MARDDASDPRVPLEQDDESGDGPPASVGAARAATMIDRLPVIERLV